MSGHRLAPIRWRRSGVQAVVATAALAAAFAFAQPSWVADPTGAYPGRQSGVEGVAYVEAASFPADLTQDQTGLFVVCDGAAADAFDLFLWVGALPIGAADAAGTLEVLSRRASDAARSARWSLEVDSVVGEVVVASPTVRAVLLDDLRRGGTLAVRLVTDPAAGAAQPTFVFEVDGFPEDVLDCASRAAAANDPFAGAPVVPVEPVPGAPSDPFADVPVEAPPAADPFADAPAAPPADPFAEPPAAAAPPADPFADAPPADPFADAPPADPFAGAPAPGGPGDDLGFDELAIDPTTGLPSLFGDLENFAPLPPRVDLTALVSDADRALVYANTEGGFSAIGGFCAAEGGGDNGFIIELASPAFATYGETATLILYDQGFEVGFVRLGVYRVDGGEATGYFGFDDEEVGFLRALDAFPALEALVSGDGVSVAEAYWSFPTAELRAAIAAMPCAP